MQQKKSFPKYFVFTENELLSLIVCIVLDISEYMVVLLIMPVTGDIFDLVGIVASFIMFRWVGLISLLELVPGVDILPTFIITWLIWYYQKKLRKSSNV